MEKIIKNIYHFIRKIVLWLFKRRMKILKLFNKFKYKDKNVPFFFGNFLKHWLKKFQKFLKLSMQKNINNKYFQLKLYILCSSFFRKVISQNFCILLLRICFCLKKNFLIKQRNLMVVRKNKMFYWNKKKML